MITKTDAIVLKSMKYRDTSKIVTFYTRRYGKLKAIAKGARQFRSKFGASLDPLAEVSLVLYKKEQRDLQLISQCDLLSVSKHIHDDLEKLAIGLAVLELIDQVAHEEEGHEALYSLLRETLLSIEDTGPNVVNLFFAFELRSSALLGFMPDLDACSMCHRGLDELVGEQSLVFRLPTGGILCRRCTDELHQENRRSVAASRGHSSLKIAAIRGEERVRVSFGSLKALSFLLKAPLTAVTSLELDPVRGNEIDGTLRLYLRQHFENLRTVKALDLLKKFSTS